ncbi:hypothetical protein ACJ5HV_16110, partial [Staphylococcus aureus]
HVKVLLGMFLSLKTLYRKRTVIWPFYFYTIIRTLSKWIITYDKCDEIKKMYDNLVFKEINLNYSLQNKKTAIEYMFYSKAIKSKGAIYGNYSKY